MKSRKFPTYEAAIEYLESRGKLEYFGREGPLAEIFVYTLTIGVIVWHVNLYENGLLEVVYQRYKD